jgi:hypothetical protein
MMRTLMIVFVAVSLLATSAEALPDSRTYEYSWDDGDNTILGSFEDCTAETSSVYNNPAHAGYGIALTKTTSEDSYSSAFLACVWALEAGDQVTASYWRLDSTVGYPRLRLWAHYNDGLSDSDYRGQDFEPNDGLAYGNNSFGTENGWEQFTYTWTIPAEHTGLVIDAVLYGVNGATLYVDELALTVPDHAFARMPGTYYDANGQPTAAAPTTWSNVKALFQ